MGGWLYTLRQGHCSQGDPILGERNVRGHELPHADFWYEELKQGDLLEMTHRVGREDFLNRELCEENVY